MTEDIRQKQKPEEEWFARQEAELLKRSREEHARKMAELAERQKEGEMRRLRELHYLKCPKCGHDMSVRQVDGVEVEQCGTCSGVFLDKGELETILLKQSGERRGFFRKLIGM
jgi:uncharacterized protein